MRKTLGRGLIAGAAGVTALNWVGYADMALRGRSASSAPADLAATALDVAGLHVPGSPEQRARRLDALGALAGIKAGLLVGVAASVVRAAGVRLPAPVAVALTGGAAMAVSDVPLAALGVSDPRTWSPADWVSDVVPHLAYGVATHAALTTFERRDAAREPVPGNGLSLRAFAIGWGCGARTSFGPAALALTARKPVTGVRKARSVGAVLSGLGEVVVDKLPMTPSRLEPQVLRGRIAVGAGSAGSLAHREQAPVWVPLAIGAAGAAAGSYAGAAWRQWAVRRVPDWQAALAEDVLAVLLVRAATRPA